MRHLSSLLLLFALAATSLAAETAPTTWKVGGDVRVRYYDMQNIWDWNYGDDADHWAALRLRTRVWASVDLERGVKGMIRLANQNWGEGVTDQRDAMNDRWEQDGKSSKVFVDAAYVEVDRIFDLPANLRLGRQALSYGTGFVVFDGQSHVGSTAVFFDGARLRLTPGANVNADLIYLIDQENRRDETVPDDIVLMGLYLTHAPSGGELYALRRVDDLLGKDIRLTGARFARTLAGRLDLSLEAGLQRGDAAFDIDQEAWGTKLEAGYTVAGWRPFVSYVGMSGDDPATLDVRERWDVFYGGWPQFGEHLAWTYTNLGPGNGITRYDPTYAQGSSVPGEAVYSNLLMPTLGLEVKPHPRVTAKASWSWLRADQTAPGVDDEIGTYAQIFAKYTYSKNLAFSVYGGYLDPGPALGNNADPQHLVYCDAELTF
jgi:hypothetical protein